MNTPKPQVETFEISEVDVRDALESLLYSTSDRLGLSLEWMGLVSERLVDPDFPNTPHARKIALQEVLVSAITEGLVSHRINNNIQPPDFNDSLSLSQEMVVDEAQTGNIELLSWSWLYYRYVRVDLNMTPLMYCEASNLDERTLRRYQRHAIRRLTFSLIKHERLINHLMRKQLLYIQLPSSVPTRLFGRQETFNRVELLLKEWPPHHFMVTGNVGIGKTAFIQESVRQLIDKEEIDYLVWMTQPESVADIRNCLSRVLKSNRTGLSLREYAARYELAVVLDQIDNLRSETTALEELLNELGTELVYIAERTPIYLANAFNMIALRELNQAETFAMVYFAAKGLFPEGIPSEIVQSVWEVTNGNPLAIRRALQQIEYENMPIF